MRTPFIFAALAASLFPLSASAQQSALQQLGAGAMPEVTAVAVPMALPGGTLTVYAYPPYRPLSWKTPKAALTTLFPNMVAESLPGGHQVDFLDENGDQDSMSSNNRSSVGHVITHVSCTLTDGKTYDAWTGFSGDEDPAVDKDNLLHKKLGLGVLFKEYTDGHVISGDENRLELIYYKGRKGIAPRYWQQNIDGAACGRVRDMVEFFRGFGDAEGRPEATPLYYTFNIDPYQSYLARLSGQNARVGADCFNCLNQHHPVIINSNLIRSGSLDPAPCGSAGTNCTATEAAQAGFDYGVLNSKGYDYVGLANSQGSTLSSLYGQPTAWQNPRTMRFQVRFTF